MWWERHSRREHRKLRELRGHWDETLKGGVGLRWSCRLGARVVKEVQTVCRVRGRWAMCLEGAWDQISTGCHGLEWESGLGRQ